MIIVVTIALATKCAFFITCDTGQLVGWNTPYENRFVYFDEINHRIPFVKGDSNPNDKCI